MKKLLALCLCMLALGVAASEGDDRPVRIEQLPARAQQFLKTHFGAVDISYAKEDSEWREHTYEVVFVDGNKVEFNRTGEWREVDCKYTSVPQAIVPQPILGYVKENHRGQRILKIERDRRGYEVKLSGGLELKFDRNFKVTGIDD